MMDEEARKIVSQAYERTRDLLVEKKEQLRLLAERLLEKVLNNVIKNVNTTVSRFL
jgi:ATP-dependent Zn protease